MSNSGTDLENLKVILEHAKVPYYISPVKTAPGYTIIRTLYTFYTFDKGGRCCEVVNINQRD